MPYIHDVLAAPPSLSFEFFPPRNEKAETVLDETLRELEPLKPSFVSITYGAGGSTKTRTRELVEQINSATSMMAMAHLTCVTHTRAELVEIVSGYQAAGIENLLALGGDPPQGEEWAPGELSYAIDLVHLAREIGDFSIGVAAHPEPHPRSPDLASDREHTAEKLAVADFAITQFFFDTEHYFELVEALRDHGVDKPVVPGIMPITNTRGIKRMTELQGSELPGWLAKKLHAVEDDPEAVRRIGIEEATKLCRTLLDGGAPGLHFYTVNRSAATTAIVANLGLSTS